MSKKAVIILNPFLPPERRRMCLSDIRKMIPEECHMSLMALDHIDVPLYIIGEVGAGMPNSLATKIVRYLRHPYKVKIDHDIYGRIILVCDNGDITDEIWAEIFKTIKSKKKKEFPEHLEEHFQNTRELCDQETDPKRMWLAKKYKPQRSWYGLIES